MSAFALEPTFDEFTKLVHNALSHLYDSPYLQAHLLARLLVDPGTVQPSQELRRVLLQAMRTMRPQAGTPAQSVDWRSYRILELRFIEGRNLPFIMEELALSRSQFFRDQARIIEAVAAALWQGRRPISSADLMPTQPTRNELARSEAQRLLLEAHWEELDGAHLVEGLRSIVESLATAKQVTARIHLTYPLRLQHVDRVMLRQTMLNVITYAMDMIPGGVLELCSLQENGENGVRMVAHDTGVQVRHPGQRQGTGLGIAVELMQAMGGSLRVDTADPSRWSADLVWPARVTPVLLVIDDNEEFANLCRRYLSTQPWQVVSASSASAARQAIALTRPAAILLDIMMPQEDGWELLMWLKTNPATSNLHVAICSVLNEPDLAAMLGAEAYLTKPLSQQALLKTLLEWHPRHTSRAPLP